MKTKNRSKQYAKKKRFTQPRNSAEWRQIENACNLFVKLYKQPAYRGDDPGHAKFSKLYRVVQGFDYESAARACLASQFSRPFSQLLNRVVDTRILNWEGAKSYRGIFLDNLTTMTHRRDFNLPIADLESMGFAGDLARRLVIADDDSHPNNFGYITRIDGKKIMMGFDFDQSFSAFFMPSLFEIEQPGYLNPLNGWELIKFSDFSFKRPLNYFTRSWLQVGFQTNHVTHSIPFFLKKLTHLPFNRRVLEGPDGPSAFLAEELKADFLPGLAASEIARRQYFMKLIFDSCIPDDWFGKIKDAHLPAKRISISQKKYAGEIIKFYKNHLAQLREAVFMSGVFRKDFLENFEEYKTFFIKSLDSYNAEYKSSNPALNPLKINILDAIKKLDLILSAAKTLPVPLGSFGYPFGYPSDEILMRKILQILAYLNLPESLREPASHDPYVPLENLLENLKSRSESVISSLSHELKPEQAEQYWIFLRDFRQASASLIFSEKLNKTIEQIEEQVKRGAAEFYKKEPERAVKKIENFLNKISFGFPHEKDAEEAFKTLGLFLLSLTQHSIMQTYPVLCSLGQPLKPEEYGLTEEVIVNRVLLAFEESRKHFEPQYYMKILEIMECFSEALSQKDFLRFIEILEENLKVILDKALAKKDRDFKLIKSIRDKQSWAFQEKFIWTPVLRLSPPSTLSLWSLTSSSSSSSSASSSFSPVLPPPASPPSLLSGSHSSVATVSYDYSCHSSSKKRGIKRDREATSEKA